MTPTFKPIDLLMEEKPEADRRVVAATNKLDETISETKREIQTVFDRSKKISATFKEAS
ncbi:MAG: hypothetical protein AAFQ15_16645 [Pseudomonadota bacterium]